MQYTENSQALQFIFLYIKHDLEYKQNNVIIGMNFKIDNTNMEYTIIE